MSFGVQEVGSSRDGEFRRRGVHKMGSSGDGGSRDGVCSR